MGRIKKTIATLLPGIFLIGYNVGTGSITSMSKAGANFGLDLLWTVLISSIITFYLINLFSKYTMVTGETVVQGIKNHISPWLAQIIILALSLIILGALMGVLGIISNVLEVWSLSVFGSEISATWCAIIVSAVLYSFMLIGNYAFFEKILAVLVAIMGAAFLMTMFMNFPDLSKLAQGLVPKIPDAVSGSDNSPFVIIAGLVGTTVSVFAFVVRSQIIKDTSWKMKDYKIQKRDAAVSASLMFLISAAVMITAATTLHVQGLKLNNVTEMIPLMEPLAGKLALAVFVIGITAAGLSSHLPNLLMIPWLIIDYRGEERNTRTPRYLSMLFILSIFSVIGVIMEIRPVFLMLISQAFISIVMPIILGAIIYLASSRNIMGKYKNNAWDLIVQSSIMVFALYISGLGIQGLIMDLMN